MMKRLLFFVLLFVNLQVVMQHGQLIVNLGASADAQHMCKENGATYCSDDGIQWWRSCFDNSCDGVSTSFSCPYCGCNNESEGVRLLHMAACPERPDDTDDDGPYRCRKYCTQLFDTWEILENHEKQCKQQGTGPGGGGGGSGTCGDGASSGTTGTTGSKGLSSGSKGQTGGGYTGGNSKDTLKITVYVPSMVPIGSLGAKMANLAYMKRGSQEYSKTLQVLNEQYGVNEATTLIKKLENMGYTLDDPETGFKCTVLMRKVDGVNTYIVAFAGTDFGQELEKLLGFPTPADCPDIKNDIQQALIGPSSQYVQALALATELVNEMGSANVSFLGHSLGGGLATIAGMATQSYSIGYNPACLSSQTIDWMKDVGCNPDPYHVLNYISTTDELKAVQSVIGSVYQGQTQEVYPYANCGGHSIENMIENLERKGY